MTGWNAAQERNWRRDCLHWRGRVLTGKYRHWCDDWDGLPIDETTPEWPCVCADALVRHDTKTKTLETE